MSSDSDSPGCEPYFRAETSSLETDKIVIVFCLMRRPFVSLAALLFALCLGASALLGDTYAFVTKLSNASTLSFLDPASGRETSGLPLQLETIQPAAYSLDDKFAFVIDFSLSAPDTVNVFGLASGKQVKEISFPGTPFYVAPSADASKVFAIVNQQQSNYVLYQINVPAFDIRAVYSSSDLHQFASSPDGKFVYVAGYNTVTALDATTFKKKGSVVVSGGVNQITVSPDSKRLYVSSESPAQIVALNAPALSLAGTIPADPASVAVSPDSATFYIVANPIPTGQIAIEQVSSATLTVTNTVTLGPVDDQGFSSSVPLAISPDGKTLAVGYGVSAPSVTFLGLPAMTVGPISPVGNLCGLAFTPGSTVAITNCYANTAEIVDITKGVVSAQVDAGPSPTLTLAAPNGKAFYVSNPWGVWTLSAQTGKVLAKVVLSGYNGNPVQLALSANKRTLFAMDGGQVAEISTSINTIMGHVPGIPAGFSVTAIATSPDGKYLFAGGVADSQFDDRLLVLDQTSGALLTDFSTQDYLPVTLVPSRDSASVLLIAEFHNTSPALYTFNVAAGTLTMDPAPVSTPVLTLSPDGTTLYFPDSGASVYAYNIATQTSTLLPSPVAYTINGIGVTPDGSELILTNNGNSIGVLNLANPVIGNLIPAGGQTSGISLMNTAKSQTPLQQARPTF